MSFPLYCLPDYDADRGFVVSFRGLHVIVGQATGGSGGGGGGRGGRGGQLVGGLVPDLAAIIAI